MPSSPCLHPLLGVLEGQRLLVIPRAPGHHPVLRVRSDPYLPEHTNTVTHTHTGQSFIFTCGGVSYWLSLLSHWSRPTGGSSSTRLTNGTSQSRGGPRSPVGPLEETDIFVTYVHIRSHTYNRVCKISSRTFLGHNFTSRLKIKQYNNYIYLMWLCEIIGRDYVQKVQRARSALPLPLIQLGPYTREHRSHDNTGQSGSPQRTLTT